MISSPTPLTAGELITILQGYAPHTPVFIDSNFATEVYDVQALLFDDENTNGGQHHVNPLGSPYAPEFIPGKTTYGVRIAGRHVDEIRTQRIENPQDLHKTPDPHN